MNKINNYELLSGDVVSDAELSGELGMSRTPVREAMMQLINDGILQRTSTRVVVKPLTLSDIYEILEIREALEIASAGRILRRDARRQEQQCRSGQCAESCDCLHGLHGLFIWIRCSAVRGSFFRFSMIAFAVPSLHHHSPSHIHSHFPLSPSLAFSFSASLGRSVSGGYACCLSRGVFLRGSMWMLTYVSAPYRSLSLRSTSDERSCASARVMLPSRRTCISMAR